MKPASNRWYRQEQPSPLAKTCTERLGWRSCNMPEGHEGMHKDGAVAWDAHCIVSPEPGKFVPCINATNERTP